MSDNSLRSEFLLNPEVVYLNFGSFGACPRPIFEEYQRWQRELEFQPVQYFTNTGVQQLKNARAELGAYVGCAADDLVFVTNPSFGVNIVAKNLDLRPGDEILSTDLEYGACDRTWNYYCKKSGAVYVRQKIQLPLTTKEQFVEDLFRGCSSRTRLIFLSHITSSTALILPVKEVIQKAREKGIPVFVDGAHAPGQIPVDLGSLGPDYYTGASHKWMMAPKGSSFLFVSKENQASLDPLVVSWGYESTAPSDSQFQDYHQMQGTRDLAAFLAVPSCIEFMKQHNWKDVSARCRKLVKDNAERFSTLLGVGPLAPLTDEFIAQMLSFPIRPLSAERLQRYLWLTYNIEIPLMRHDDKVYLRFSINAFNDQSDLDKLYAALKEIIEVTDFLDVKKMKD